MWADEIVSRVQNFFSCLQGCHCIALVGSRGRGKQVDRYSDADFLICVDPDLRQKLIRTNWAEEISPVRLQFPLVLPDEVRVLFKGYFDCDFHFYTPQELNKMQGPCQLGDYLSQGWKILNDPRDLLYQLNLRVEPQPAKLEDSTYPVTTAVFWFNVVLVTKYILRGDIFRAYRLSNWWLQQILLEMLEPKLPEDSLRHKNIAARLPKHYPLLSRSFARLDREDMIRGLKECLDLFWQICIDKPVELTPEQEKQFRLIQVDVLQMLSGDESCLG